jgi:hypothetical protein
MVGHGAENKTSCKVEKKLIERLQGRALEWQGNTQLIGMGGELLKAMARVWALHSAATADDAAQHLVNWVHNQVTLQALKTALGMQDSDQRIELYTGARSGVATCKNGAETFTISIDLTTGKLHIDLDASACCPERAQGSDIREYHVSVVASVLIFPEGKLSFGSPFLVNPYGRCCDLMAVESYQSLFTGLSVRSSGSSQGSQPPSGNSKDSEYTGVDCEKLLSEIKELHESIELKQAELEALQKAETPDDAAIDGVNGLIDDWQQAMASSIEIWDTNCDKTILEEEMQRLIWLYAPKPEEPQAEEGEGSSVPEKEQPKDASLAPGGSTLLLVDDVVLDSQSLCEGDGLHNGSKFCKRNRASIR